MIPKTRICYKNMITLCLLMEKLSPDKKIIDIRDSFSETVFYEILSKEKLDAIRRNSNTNAFYNGNIRFSGKKRCFHASKSVRALSYALTEPDLIRASYTQLIRNCRNIFYDAERRGIRITDEFFDFIDFDNVYSRDLFDLINLCIARHRRESALALTVIIAVFQETSPEVILLSNDLIQLLTDPSVEHQIDADMILEICSEQLQREILHEGRFIRYNDATNKMDVNCVTDLFTVDADDSVCSLISCFLTQPCENMLLIGPGGSGKTFAMIDLAEQLIKNNNGILPFYLPLHTLNSKSPDDKFPIISSFTDIVSGRCGISKEILFEFLRSHSNITILFLLDDYDELTEKMVKINVISEIMQIEREFNSVRFIISSRHDNSETFASGRGMPFRIKQLMPPDDKSVRSFLNDYIGDDMLWQRINDHLSSFADFLYNPMALNMYAYAQKTDMPDDTLIDPDASLLFSRSDTLCKLLNNFTEQLKSTRSLKKNPAHQSDTEAAVKLLYCITFAMYARNKISLTQQGMKLFFSEALIKYNTFERAELTMDFYPSFLSVIKKMGLFICSRASNWQYVFYYPVFIKYFTARYLHYALRSALVLFDNAPDTAVEILCEAFSITLSDDLLRFTGELSYEQCFSLVRHNKPDLEHSLIGQALHFLHARPHSPAVISAVNSLRRIAGIAFDA